MGRCSKWVSIFVLPLLPPTLHSTVASERCRPDERRQSLLEAESSDCSLQGLVHVVDITNGQKVYRSPVHKLVKLLDQEANSQSCKTIQAFIQQSIAKVVKSNVTVRAVRAVCIITTIFHSWQRKSS